LIRTSPTAAGPASAQRPLGFTDWQLFTHSSYEYRADPMGR
jgi:hypothetical protein